MQFQDSGCAYDAVLFDWNGTLVDDIERALAAANVALGAANQPLLEGVADVRSTFRLPLVDWFCHLGVRANDVHAAAVCWNAELARRPAVLRAGARELLCELRAAGIVAGVVSAASHRAVTGDARRLEIIELLARIDADATDKQSAIRASMHALGTHRVFYIGDTEYDMVAASEAGATPIGLSGGYRPAAALEAAGARAVCHSLDQLGLLLRPTGRA